MSRMAFSEHKNARATAGPASNPSRLLQRKCSCGAPTASLTGKCPECQRRQPLQRKPAVELQRQEAAKEKTNEEKYQQGLAKMGEAFLQTPLGKALLEKIRQDTLVKGVTDLGQDFISTWPGKIVTGAAATGAVAALAATHKELPAQIPEIPLDALTPGLSVRLTYKGPVDRPTEAMITFKYTEQVPKSRSGQKPLSEAEKFRAETARLAAEAAKFRASMTYPPGSPEDLQQKAEQEAIRNAALRYSGGPGVNAMTKQYPWLVSPQPKAGQQLTLPKPSFGTQPPLPFGNQFKLKLPEEQKKNEDEPALQKKLSIGANNDPLEQEADRVADQVLAAPAQTVFRASSPHIQRHAGLSTDSSIAVPSSVDRALANSGQPLQSALRQDMEQRFGQNFSHVLVHTGKAAEESAQEINAHAYTVRNNIVFGAGKYSPETHAGRRLIAHELTHTIQQSTAGPFLQEFNSCILQRFGSEEHVRIGSNALPSTNVLIPGYGDISYGEMIAMIGDYFESLSEMQSLAQMGRFGTQQIDFVRWKINPHSSPEPSVDSGVQKAVDERYSKLASKNETHFSIGSSTGKSNREQYVIHHMRAIRDAYAEGAMPLGPKRGWQAQEAGSNHFLTDAFSAGHIRTPRGQIQAHWNSIYPSFSNNLVGIISCYMASYINGIDNVGYFVSVDYLSDKIAPVIREKGGAALSLFSIGDLISKVMHDADNAGLDTLSHRGPAGTGTSSYSWRAVGDEYLFPSTPNAAATQTQQMVQEAVKLSFQETQQAFSAGTSKNTSIFAILTNQANFRALALLPEHDPKSIRNPIYLWEKPKISDLPENLQLLINTAFSSGTEIRRRIDSLPVPITYSSGGFTLHTGDAWSCFKNILIANPFNVIKKTCAGDICPPKKNNPCQ